MAVVVGREYELHVHVLTFRVDGLCARWQGLAVALFGVVVVARLDLPTISVGVFDVGAAWAVFFFGEVVPSRPCSILCGNELS